MQRRASFSTIILLLGLVTTACLSSSRQSSPTPDASTYEVDPVFREFYHFLGGKDTLGEAISLAHEKNGVYSQYTVSAQMIFDPQAPATHRFQLGSLGREFGIADSVTADWQVADVFEGLYNQLGGETFSGKPLTGLVYNAEKDRSEQYFENLGFYRGPETGGEAQLLPYGVWRCGEECRASLPLNAAPLVTLPTQSSATQPVPTHTPPPRPTTPAVQHHWIVQVWTKAPLVSANQPQDIGLSIQRDRLPLQDAVAELLVELPDGTKRQATFHPTDENGVAHLSVEPIPSPNGTIIPYQVCITGEAGDVYCIQQSYIISTTP
jgi:hypothetical protein